MSPEVHIAGRGGLSGRLRATLALVALALIVAAGLVASAPPPTPSFPDHGPSPNLDPVHGASLGLFASDPGYDYGQLVGELQQRGATDVLVVVVWSQPSSWSSQIRDDAPGSAPPEVILRTLGQIQQAGMRASVMPIIRLQERTPTQWRGNITPDVRPWLQRYREVLLPLAALAQQGGARRLIIGSELGSMHVHEAPWRALIRDARRVFHGRLTYSANWDDFDSVPFWDALDEVGVTGYFPVPGDPVAAWAEPLERLAALRARTGKPLLITEIGYPSHRRAAQTPWDQLADDVPDPELQARLTRAFCDAVQVPRDVDGYFFWNWFGFGGRGHVSFTPRGKPAAAEMERCWRR